jgi:hypothetical protein
MKWTKPASNSQPGEDGQCRAKRIWEGVVNPQT